jgi:hypothetical protein
MLPILQMDFEIAYSHFGTRGVQFARTVVAADARQIHVFYSFRSRLAGWGGGAGELGGGVDG